MTEQDIHNRIERMEAKIDKLVDAMTELVKLQPTINAINERLQSHSIQIDSLDKRQDKMEQRAPVWDICVKVGWIVLGAVILAVVGALLNGVTL